MATFSTNSANSAGNNMPNDNSTAGLQAEMQNLDLDPATDSGTPCWIPCDMYCPSILATPMPRPGAQMADNRSDWELRSLEDGWSTIPANTGFTTGLHYYEFKISAMPSKEMMFGLLFPPDDDAFAVDMLSDHLGRPGGEPLLGKHSIGFHFSNRHLKRHVNGAVRGSSFLPEMDGWADEHREFVLNHVGRDHYHWDTRSLLHKIQNQGKLPADFFSPREGTRIGLLLDLLKYEFRMFYFSPDNTTDTPTSEHLLATLHRGRRYFPAFSLHGANTVLQLTTVARPPESQQMYLDRVAQLAARQRDSRMRMHEMEQRNQALELFCKDLQSRYLQVHAILTSTGLDM